MLFSEWHLDYRGALFTTTVNTSFSTIALLSLGNAALRIKNKERVSAAMWIWGTQRLLRGYSRDLEGDGGGKHWRCMWFGEKRAPVAICTEGCFCLNATLKTLSSLLSSSCTTSTVVTLKYRDIQFLLCKNIHCAPLSKCKPQQLSLHHLPLSWSLLSPVLTQTSIFLILEGSHIALVTHFKCISD